MKRELGANMAADNAGTYTWTFLSGNRFRLHGVSQFGSTGPDATGDFSIRGDQLTLNFNPPYPGTEQNRCAMPTYSKVSCRWESGDDGWNKDVYMGGMTQPLTR
jgi:hypothetical protein